MWIGGDVERQLGAIAAEKSGAQFYFLLAAILFRYVAGASHNRCHLAT
jgi:hypothetical protein